MSLFWFFCGVLCTIASMVLLLPWLRTIPRFATLPQLPWQVGACALLMTAGVLGTYHWLLSSVATPIPPGTGNTAASATAFANAAKTFSEATRDTNSAPTAAAASAGPMDQAISSLEKRLATGSGTPDDWELLAKSYDFVGRSADAVKARAHQLAISPTGADGGAPLGDTISGVVTVASALQSKATSGAVLFIVAKSVDSPGAPVAVFRSSVGRWPFKFKLDDSQSMLPGRNLSTAGRITVEARISQSGQALPGKGDLQGTSGIIDPADHRELNILIDRVIT